MKVLHINQSDLQGGAAIAGYRLHRELLNRSVDSRLIVRRQVSGDKEVAGIGYRRLPDGLLAKASSIVGLNNLLTYRSFKLSRNDWYQEADVLNLHNLHPGYFNYLSLPRLTSKKPAVHTLHDMWALTGHCAYSFDCERWQNGCGKCVYPYEYPEIGLDNTRLALKLKKWAYVNSNIHLIAPSQWLMGLLEKSVLASVPRYYVPNGIDLKIYEPADKTLCRKVLGIPSRSYVVMFAAESLADKRKGASFLNEALSDLPLSLQKDVVLLSLGKGSLSLNNTSLFNYPLGYIENDHLKAIAYNAADMFLFTSIQDNLPLVLQESMACGTPMVAFNAGGVSELVRNNETGILVEAGNTKELTNMVVKLIEDSQTLKTMGETCRRVAEAEYSINLQAERYVDIYKSILQQNTDS
jgi:glycosyltransferase involved in cell wall biosynthesis